MQTKRLPEASAYGIDIGKNVFHVVAVSCEGAVIQRVKFARETLQSFFDLAPKSLIGKEACPGSRWLARRLIEKGHDARIIPVRLVKPYVKSNKTDTVDAAAIAEAVTRSTMRFVQPSVQLSRRGTSFKPDGGYDAILFPNQIHWRIWLSGDLCLPENLPMLADHADRDLRQRHIQSDKQSHPAARPLDPIAVWSFVGWSQRPHCIRGRLGYQ